MDNNTLNTTNDTPAFDYQPPAVETPETPTVTDIPSSTEEPAKDVFADSVEQPVQPQVQQTYQQPVQQAYQQPVQQAYQQPVQQTYQQPVQQTYQQPVQQAYQQPVQQAYQQPYQQTYQQPVQQSQTQSAYTQQPYYQYAPVNPALVSQQNTSDGFAIASLICGIAGLVACCTGLPSILAVVFGAISKAKNDGTRPTGMSTAGLILGIIGIIVNIFTILSMLFYN